MVSPLGNIIQVSRTVLEQREFVQIQYERYLDGTLEDDAFGTQKFQLSEVPQNHKRKREEGAELDSELVDNQIESMGKVKKLAT